MDIQRLQAIARDLMEIPDAADDFRYFVGSFAVMLSDDPLTLDAAVQVMGREPDREAEKDILVRRFWEDSGLYLSLRSRKHDEPHVVVVNGREYLNPTIGQFACLVAAARMGESK